MPWSTDDAAKSDKKVKTAKEKRQWRDIANSTLKRTGDEGLAKREANGVILREKIGLAKGHGG